MGGKGENSTYDINVEVKPKRPVGRPKTGRSMTMAEYQKRCRDRYLEKGIHTFSVELPFEVIELIKEMAYQNHKTQAEVIVDLVKAANEVRRP